MTAMSDNPQNTAILSIVIPVYNERDTWKVLLQRVEQVQLAGIAKQIILVDDGSSDGTRAQLEEFAGKAQDLPPFPQAGQTGFKVVFHAKNQGKGAALRTGFAAATGDVVIIQDADLEYDPSDYPSLAAPIIEGRADVVYGSRFRNGRPPNTYWKNYAANRLLTAFSNLLTGLKITDMETCYKVFRRPLLQSINLQQNRFGFEPEITAKIAATGARIEEIAISYVGRTHSEGKKIGWKDGLKALWCIVKYGLFSRMRKRTTTS